MKKGISGLLILVLLMSCTCLSVSSEAVREEVLPGVYQEDAVLVYLEGSDNADLKQSIALSIAANIENSTFIPFTNSNND